MDAQPGKSARVAARTALWVGELDQLVPPARARDRVLDAMRVASRAQQPAAPGRPASPRRPARWVALAAGLGVVAVGAAWLARSDSGGGAGLSGDSPPLAGPATLSPIGAATRAELLEASQRLEFMLAGMPAQRRLMRADTATTIAALETQIAFIDERLLLGTSAGLEPELEQLLWRDRVDALNALVQVRYGQSRVFEY